MTTKEFDIELNKFLDANDEPGARTFILDHYVDLPKERQERLAWAFLEEAADYAARESEALVHLQTEAFAALDA